MHGKCHKRNRANQLAKLAHHTSPKPKNEGRRSRRLHCYHNQIS